MQAVLTVTIHNPDLNTNPNPRFPGELTVIQRRNVGTLFYNTTFASRRHSNPRDNLGYLGPKWPSAEVSEQRIIAVFQEDTQNTLLNKNTAKTKRTKLNAWNFGTGTRNFPGEISPGNAPKITGRQVTWPFETCTGAYLRTGRGGRHDYCWNRPSATLSARNPIAMTHDFGKRRTLL